MSSEITMHTGSQGDRMTIHVDWFDENYVPRHNDVVIEIVARDKPRTLRLLCDGEEVVRFERGKRCTP